MLEKMKSSTEKETKTHAAITRKTRKNNKQRETHAETFASETAWEQLLFVPFGEEEKSPKRSKLRIGGSVIEQNKNGMLNEVPEENLV